MAADVRHQANHPKVLVAAGGRFHMPSVANAVAELGTYSVVVASGIARKSAFSNRIDARVNLLPNVLRRSQQSIPALRSLGPPSIIWDPVLGRWIRKIANITLPRVVHCWGAYALETFVELKDQVPLVLENGSFHIQGDVEALGQHAPPAFLSKRWVERLLQEYAMADVILLPSEAARLEFIARGHAAERLRVMNYAVDERFFAERPEDVVNRFLVVGNLTHQKGADLLVEALRKGVLRGHEVRVIGRDVGPTTQFARTLSELGAAVQPPGRQDSLLSLYAASTWLILSSRREGFGLVVLESMAAGCIPLVSRGAGAADVAAEIDPRLTFPPTLDGLVAAVEWARGLSFEEVAHLSSMSVSVARNRTWAAYADTCDQTYASLFDDARFRGR